MAEKPAPAIQQWLDATLLGTSYKSQVPKQMGGLQKTQFVTMPQDIVPDFEFAHCKKSPTHYVRRNKANYNLFCYLGGK